MEEKKGEEGERWPWGHILMGSFIFLLFFFIVLCLFLPDYRHFAYIMLLGLIWMVMRIIRNKFPLSREALDKKQCVYMGCGDDGEEKKEAEQSLGFWRQFVKLIKSLFKNQHKMS